MHLTRVRMLAVLAAGAIGFVAGERDRIYAQTAPSAPQASSPAGGSEAEKSIRDSAQRFVDAFNKGDAKTVAALWADDGDYVDDDGERSAGRAAIEKKYAAFFAANRDAKIEITVDAIHQAGPETAIEDGRSKVTLTPHASPENGRYAVVHVKRDGKWQMASVRELAAASPEESDPLHDLEWMVGAWKAEHLGVEIDVDCRWLANKSFVEATYSKREGKTLTPTATQIIGVNPRTGRIMSWMFNGDGGCATGDWTPRDAGWAIDFEGAKADGTPTTAVNMLFRVGDALVWKSTSRRVAGQPLPDTEEVVLKRK